MASNDLDIVLRLVDQLTPMMARVQSNLKASLAAMGGSTGPLNAALDQVAKGMNVAGQQASASGKLIAWMGQAGKEAADRLAALDQASKQSGQSTQLLSGAISGLVKQITTMAAGFVTAQAAIGLVRGAFDSIVGTVKESVTAYADAEKAQSKLTAALRQHGLATPTVIGEYNAMATQFQRTTVFSDDLIASMQGLLTQVGGVMPSKMKDALKASTDLAAGLGIDLESATLLVAKAAAGHTETLGRYGITVSDAALQTKGFDAVLEAVNRQFGGQAAAQIDTYAGRVEQLKNAWNNVEEAIGRVILKNPLFEQGLRSLAELANHADEKSQGLGLSLTALAALAEHAFFTPGLTAYVAQLELAADHANQLDAALKRALSQPLPDEWKRLIGGQLPPTAPPFTGDVGSFGVAAADRLKVSDADRLKMVLQDLQQKTDQLSSSQKAAALSAFAHGKSIEETVKALELYWPNIDKTKGALTLLHAEYDKGIEKEKRWREAGAEIASVAGGQFTVLNRLGNEWTTYIAGLAKAGVSQAALALRFSLTETEIKNIIQSVENYDKVLGLNNQTSIATEEVLKKIGVAANDADSRLIAMASTLNKIADVERGLALTNLGELPGFKVDPKDGLKEIEDRAKRVDDAFRSMADTLRSLGQTAGGSFGQILSGLGSMIELIHAAENAAAAVRAKGAAVTQADLDLAAQTRRQAILGGISIGASVAASGIDTSGHASRGAVIAHDALQGAAIGASIGANPALASVSMGTSVGIGAGVGALVGWIRSGKEWRQVIQDISRDFAGIKVSDDFAHMIADLEDQTGIGSAQAMVLTIDQLVQSVGGLTTANLDMFTGHLRDAFSFFQRGEISAAQLTQVLDKNFQNFAAAGTDSMGRLNDKVKELIRLQDVAGVQSKGIADYLKGQGAAGLSGGAGALGLADVFSTDWMSKNIGEASQQLDNLGTIALRTFAAAVASGTSMNDAFAALHPGLTQLAKDYADLGIPIEDAGLKALLLEDTIVGGNPKVINAIDGLVGSLVALDNMDALDPKTFVAMQGSAVTAFQNLYNAALNAGGGAKEALIPMQGWLHAAMEEAAKLGLRLDDGTQALIDQSRDLGVWRDDLGKAESPLDKLIDRIGDLIDLLMGIPKDIAPNIRMPPAPDWSAYVPPDFQGGQYQPTSFASEAFVRRPTLAMVGDVPGGEYILRPSTISAWLTAAAGAGANGAVGGTTTTQVTKQYNYNVSIVARTEDQVATLREFVRSDGVQIVVEEIVDGRYVSELNRALNR